MATSPSSFVGCFAAMHILSRGTEKGAPDYLLNFDEWFEREHGFRREMVGGECQFVRTRLTDPVVISAQIDSLPLKAYWRSFLDHWPRNVRGDHIFHVFGQPTPHLAKVRQLRAQLHQLTDGSRAGMFLVPFQECEDYLLQALLEGSVKSWGRRFSPKGPAVEHEVIARAQFIGNPLLDWISGTLGERGSGREVSSRKWQFPDPPIFADVRFQRDQIEWLRQVLVAEKRATYLDNFDEEARESAATLWEAGSGEPGNPPAPWPNLDKYPPRTAQEVAVAPFLTISDATGPKTTTADRICRGAEAYFMDQYADNGVPKQERVTRKAAFEDCADKFRSLSKNRFIEKIWNHHAPIEWRKKGRF